MFSNKKIIIVNASKSISKQLDDILIDTNSIFDQAENISELYDLIESNNRLIDLIIFDISLEYEEGLNLIRQFKKSNNNIHIPIIITSVYSSRNFVISAKKLQIADFIKKPFGKQSMLDRLSFIFDS